jgi:hypothetical protein
MHITILIRALPAGLRKQRALTSQDPVTLLSTLGDGLVEEEVEDEPPQFGLRTVVALPQHARWLGPAI